MWGTIGRGGRYGLRGLVDALRRLFTTGLWILILGFLILFGLQLPHPPKWDTWEWVVLLRQFGKPILAQIDSTLEWPAAKPFYALALAILCVFAQILLDSSLRQLSRLLVKNRSAAPVAAD